MEQEAQKPHEESFKPAVDPAELEHIHEVALKANDILTRAEERHTATGDPTTERPTDLPRFTQAGSAAAIDFAEVAVKHAASSPAVDRIMSAAADVIAPDLEERRRAAERAASTDEMTGLANRAAFDRAVAGAEAKNEKYEYVYFDADNFKEINDRHGHAAGDVALQIIADALRAAAVPGRNIRAFRLGGDEFALICEPGPDGSKHTAEAAIEQVRASLAAAVRGDSAPAEFTDSRGGHYAETSYPRSYFAKLDISGDWADSVDQADERMYERKQASKAAVRASAQELENSLMEGSSI